CGAFLSTTSRQWKIAKRRAHALPGCAPNRRAAQPSATNEGETMSLYRQVKTHAALLGLAMALSALAACNSGSDPTPVPPTTPAPTVPLIVTRIVTPRPTYTPLPTPTLDYDMNPVAGEWILRYDVMITESALADRLRYTAAAD